MVSVEERRKANIADNRRILAEIGLINPFKGLPPLKPKKIVAPPSLKKTALKRKIEENQPQQEKRARLDDYKELEDSGVRVTRRSARLHRESKGELSNGEDGKGSVFVSLKDDFDDDEECGRKHVPVPKNRPNHFGAVPGIEVGTSWPTRVECCRDGIHRPTVAGIHGSNEGAYSVALSGRYDDNVDYGDCFTYTGEGGRDLKGTTSNPKNLREAPQTMDQKLSRGNYALNKSVETGNPVRVIRGYQLKNEFAPEEGYRYDGLYTVKKAWYSVGMAGFNVWRFAFQRCPDQAPPPWEVEEEEMEGSEMHENKMEGTENKKEVEGNENQENEVEGSEKQENKVEGSENQENEVEGSEKQEKKVVGTENKKEVEGSENQESEVEGSEKQENKVEGSEKLENKIEETEKQEEMEGSEKQGNEVEGSEKQENKVIGSEKL